jgi:peroxisomal trans-2-enoyl-CoA reductase
MIYCCLYTATHSAGGQFPSPASAISKKGWNAVIDTNLTGTFLCSQHVNRAWMGENGGAIVNIIADMWRGFPMMSHTGAARAAVDNLTKSLSLEWAPLGIRVNTVAPGVIWSQSAADNYGTNDFLTAAAPSIPAQRLGTVEEVSSAVCFLLSPGATFVTGATVRVDGGGSLHSLPLFQLQPHEKMPPYGTPAPDSKSKL